MVIDEEEKMFETENLLFFFFFFFLYLHFPVKCYVGVWKLGVENDLLYIEKLDNIIKYWKKK